MVTRRPAFTGIHEKSLDSGGTTPHEGGGKLPPYGEDWFQRITDVNWGPTSGVGAVFVSGDFCCYLRTASVPFVTTEQVWVGLSSLMFSDGGGCFGCSYALVDGVSTFLMVGHGDNGNEGDWGRIIALSNDGTHWQTVLFVNDRYGFNNVVWDSKNGRFLVENFDYYTTYETAGSWVSIDGHEWVLDLTVDFFSNCPTGVQDGLVGFDPATDTVIKPEELPPDLIECSCVAFCGGIWVAAGANPNTTEWGVDHSMTVASIDGGQSWYPVTVGPLGMTGDYTVECIIGAPIGDF